MYDILICFFEFIIILLSNQRNETDMATMQIDTGGPQLIIGEEEKKDDEGLPVPK